MTFGGTLRAAAGQAAPRWRTVNAWDQGASGVVALTNAAGIVVSGGFDCTNELMDIVVNGTTQVDGYTEAVPYVSIDLADLPGFPQDFDYKRQRLLLKLDKLLTPLGTVEAGVFCGVLDQNPGAGALGAAVMIRQGSGTADNTGLVNATGAVFAGAGKAVNSLIAQFQWSYSGTTWNTRVTADAILADGNTDPGAAFGSGQSPTVGPLSSKLVLGFVHGSTDNLSNLTVQARLSWAVVDIPDPFA